jgi:o-succinylbenzoate---CoA ligase
MIVEAWLARAAASAPAAIALETPQESCSYAQLHERARAGAAELAARGAALGERVAIALPAGLDFAYALHACLLLGAVAVPVDLRLGERERGVVLDGAAVLVEEPLRMDPTRGAPPAGMRVARSVGTTGAAGGSCARAAFVSGPVHDLDAIAAIIHTSGTASAPKPIELTYGNFLWSALGSAVALGLDPGERWLCNLPLSHVGGFSILMRSVIYATTAVVHERFDTELALAALRTGAQAHGPKDRVGGVPDPRSAGPVMLVSLVATTLARLLDAGLEHPLALRCVLVGGGPVPAALLDRARAAGVPVSLTYGLTEACSQVTTLPLAETGMLAETGTRAAGARHPASVAGACLPASVALDRERSAAPTAGPPLFCTRLRIASDGEIEVAGPTVAQVAADADGWLRTGDLGKLDADGCLQVTGRKADTIVSGGENVAPTEVEAVLEEHPEVLEAAVIGRVDERWGEAVTALVVVRAGARLPDDALREHCAARLAPYKVPKRVVVVQGPLPRTRSGKLLRRELTRGELT